MKLVLINNRWHIEGTKSVTSLPVVIENIIELKLKMGNCYGSFLNKDNQFVVVSVTDQNDARNNPFNVHFCVGVSLNPKTKEPCLFIFSVKDRPLVNKIVPFLVSSLGENIVFDLDEQELNTDTVQQIFEKR